MSDHIDQPGAASRAEEFLQVFKKGAEFTQSLLKENERLRFRVLELEQQARDQQAAAQCEELRTRLRQVEEEKHHILQRIASVEQENLVFANKYAEIEAENNLLANLYITSFQLHSTFEISELLRILEEILLNLVGVEAFDLYLQHVNGGFIRPFFNPDGELAFEGPLQINAQVRSAFIKGEICLAGSQKTDLCAIVPLLIDGQPQGVLNLKRLLPQKKDFSEIDREIFTLLSNQVALLLANAAFYRQCRGKIDFQQSFFAQDLS